MEEIMAARLPESHQDAPWWLVIAKFGIIAICVIVCKRQIDRRDREFWDHADMGGGFDEALRQSHSRFVTEHAGR
jgi:hypothetical protein